jgi:DHA3 family macrolide efflux protein-like MFS transporter
MPEKWKRDAFLFISSQTISMFGSMLVQYAISWYITLETQSGSMMTLSIIFGMLPTFFISPFAGVWADRYNRKKLIIIADSVIAITTLAASLAFLAGYRGYWILFLALIIRALGGGIQMPAASALLPSLIPQDKLMRVNGMFSTIQSAIMLVSPMVSAALLTFSSIESIFFIDVSTAAFAVLILIFFLKVPGRKKTEGKIELSYFHDLKAGFIYMKNHRFIMGFFIFLAVFLFFCAPAAFLTPLQVTRNFGRDVWRLTAIEVSFSVGMMAGGIIMSTWGGFKNRVHTMIFSSLLMGTATIGLGLIPWFFPYLGIMAFFGVCLPAYNTSVMVILQEKVENAYLGRVFGVMTMISTIMMPLGMLFFGPLADITNIEVLLIGSGIVISLVSLLMAGRKSLVKEGLPSPEKETLTELI